MSDQEKIREYLLGTLEPCEADTLDTQLFLDEEFYASVCEERDTLAEDFLAGSLTPDEASRFREQCRLSPDLREAVQASRTMQQALERQLAPGRSAHRPAKAGLLSAMRSWRFFALPVLAGGICAALLTIGTMRRRSLITASPAMPQTALSQSHPASALSQPQPQTFFLTAAVTRGAVDRATVEVPPGTKEIRLEIEIRHDLVSIPIWSTELGGNGHTAPLPGCNLPQHLAGQVFLACTVDIASLPDGVYTLRMTPDRPQGGAVYREFLLLRK